MEAQPVGLIVALLSFALTGKLTVSFLAIGGIAQLALVLFWWTGWADHLRLAHRKHTIGQALFQISGLLVALLVVVGSSLPAALAGNGLPTTLLNIGLVAWLWRRSISRARGSFEYAQLATSFNVALGILLFCLLLALLLPQGKILLDAYAGVGPVFFLSGLIALSLSRLVAIRNTGSRRNDAQSDPTRTWLLALTLLGGGIVVVVLVLETIFSAMVFQQILSLFIPLWNVLGILLGWLLYGFIFVVLNPLFTLFGFLLGLLPRNTSEHSHQTVSTSPFSHLTQQGPQAIPPVVLTVGRWVVLVLVCLILLHVVRVGLQKVHMVSLDERIEEEREGLDAASLFKKQLREWWSTIRRARNTPVQMETLDPNSARAYYRELLQRIALARSDLARHPAETPDEYEARLRHSLEREEESMHGSQHDAMASSDAAILGELTRAYTRERYGGKETRVDEHGNLHIWMTRLAMRLTGKIPPKRSSNE
jgi:hypothetical protein